MRQHDDTVFRPRPSTNSTAPRGLGAALFLALALVSVAACDPPDDDDGAETASGCEQTMRTASTASEPDEQVRMLDDALVACRSYEVFTAELSKYPSIIGYSVPTFVETRCNRVDDPVVRQSPSCRTVITTTTVPPTTVPQLVYVGETLDGRTVEIVPSADTPWSDEVPAVIQQTVDIATESGCEGIWAQRDRWAAQIDDPQLGDQASVYAHHADQVAAFVQCPERE